MSQITKEEFVERRAADLKLKSSAYNGYVLLCNVGANETDEYAGFVKCTTCSKVVIIVAWNVLRFSPNKHRLCRVGGRRHVTHPPHLRTRTVRGSVSLLQLRTRTVRGPYAADADYPRTRNSWIRTPLVLSAA